MVGPAAVEHTSRRERTRRRILEAAGDRFADLGFAKTTVEEIAGAAGVSKGLVYVHFRSKEQVLEAVLERTLEEWREVTRREVERCASSVGESLAVMHRSSIQYAKEHPVLRGIMTRDPGLLLTHVREPGLRAQELWRRRLIELLEDGVASGELRPDLDPSRTADVIRLLHMAFLDRLFSDRSLNAADPALVEESIGVLLRGIEAR